MTGHGLAGDSRRLRQGKSGADPPLRSISTGEVYAPVSELLPPAPALILDVGAGTGRDAAWLAECGHRIVAVEPVDELRRAGMAIHPSPRIEWLNDSLPDLDLVLARGAVLERIFLVGSGSILSPRSDGARCDASPR